MASIKNYLTDLNNSLKSINLDGYVPYKWLFLKTQDVISDFLKKDNQSNKSVFKLSSGWSELPCVQMEEVPVTSCDIDVRLCQKLMKSKYKLPDLYEGKFGALIRQCTSVDFSNSYDPIFSARLWKNTQNREFKSKKYFFIIDGFLFIPIPKGERTTPSIVRLEGYFKNLKEVGIFNSKQECGSCSPDQVICKSVLDYDLVIPDYLSNDVKKEVLQQVINSYGRLQKDDLPNLNTQQITNPIKP